MTARRPSTILAATLLAAASLAVLPTAPAMAAAGWNGPMLGEWFALTWEEEPILVHIDRDTGAVTEIATGPASITGSAGFDVDGSSGVAYLFDYESGDSTLWSVDLATGTFTSIATVVGLSNVTAVNIGIDGEMWIAADSWPGEGVAGFGTVDRTTGTVTYLGAGPERISALGSDADGDLIGISYDEKVYSYDPGADSWTQIGTVPESVYAADFDIDGKLLTMTWDGVLDRVDVTAVPPVSEFVFDVALPGCDCTEAFTVGGPTDGSTLQEALRGGADGNGGAPTTATSGPVPTGSGSLPTMTPGVGVWQDVSGAVTTLTASSPAAGQVRYSAPGLQLTLTGASGSGTRTGLVAEANGTVVCELCAFLAEGGVIEAWVLSEPRLAAAWRTDDIARLLGDLPCRTFTIPVGTPLDGGDSLPVGVHTLQLQLPTTSGLQAVNVGVTIGAPVPTTVRAGTGVSAGEVRRTLPLGLAALLALAMMGPGLDRRRMTAGR